MVALAVAGAAVVGFGAVVIAAPSGWDNTAAPSTSAVERSQPTTTTRDVEVKGIVVTQDNPVPTEPPSTTSAAPPATVPVPPPVAAREAEPAPAPAPAPEPEPVPPPPPACPSGGGDFLQAHRSIRCENGLPDVGLDPAMNGPAQFHAQRLLEAGACSNLFHSPELASWYAGSYWGENAACAAYSGGCYGNVSTVMNGWMNSPEHRVNILDPHFRWIGVGIACDGTHTFFVVQYRS
jgi:uncharacterized protein YkwD